MTTKRTSWGDAVKPQAIRRALQQNVRKTQAEVARVMNISRSEVVYLEGRAIVKICRAIAAMQRQEAGV